MTDPQVRRLTIWALATFHAAVFVLGAVLLVYPRGHFGATLAGLNTAVGLGLFLALWATTYVTTRRALAGIDLFAAEVDGVRFGNRALRLGAANGIAFVAVLGAVLIASSMIATPPGQNPAGVLPFALFAAPFAVIFAAVIGAVVGATFGVLDLALLGVARRLVGEA